MQLNFPFGNRSSKGFIFALDAAIAVAVIIIMLIDSSYYFSTASRESLSHVQIERLGADALGVVDYVSTFSAMIDMDAISPYGTLTPQQNTQLNLSRYMPPGISYSVDINDLQDNNINNSASTFGAAACGPNDCNLSTNGDRVRISTLNLSRSGYYAMAVNAIVRQEVPLRVRLNFQLPLSGGCPTDSSIMTVNSTGLYVFPKLLCFRKGANRVDFDIMGSGNVTLNFARVVGAPEYRKTSGVQIPTDRFVAVAERPILAKYNNTLFPHLVRIYTWLK